MPGYIGRSNIYWFFNWFHNVLYNFIGQTCSWWNWGEKFPLIYSNSLISFSYFKWFVDWKASFLMSSNKPTHSWYGKPSAPVCGRPAYFCCQTIYLYTCVLVYLYIPHTSAVQLYTCILVCLCVHLYTCILVYLSCILLLSNYTLVYLCACVLVYLYTCPAYFYYQTRPPLNSAELY